MNAKLHSTLRAAPALVLAMLVSVGCGQQGAAPGGDSGSSGEAGGGPTVGLVTDIGGLNDRSFNFQANEGLKKAESELGASGSVVESKSAGDYETNLGQLVQAQNDLIVGVGFSMADAIKAVSAKAPESKFAIVDYPVEALGSPSNVRGLVFREEEAGYLAGALVGMVEEEGSLKGLNGPKVVSAIGGQKIPPVEKYIAGYQAGVKAFCPTCEVLVDYSQDFIDQAKCQDRALAQIDRGSDVIFQVAGQCGLGALDAAEQKGIWGVGVDADQSHLGPHVLTSALKRVDIAMYDTIESVADDTFEGGVDATYGLAEDGVGIGEVAPAAQKYEAELAKVIADVKAGSVEIPTEVT